MFSSKFFDKISPLFTPKEICLELKLGEKVEGWMAGLTFSEKDPLLILDFKAMDNANQEQIANALVQNGAENCEYSDIIYKFDTWSQLNDARDYMQANFPWLFYNPSGNSMYMRNGQCIKYPEQCTIQTIAITFYSDDTNQLMVIPFEFFKH